jgi:hypothetical protein
MQESLFSLRLKEVNEQHHSRDLAPATSANDWWPPSEDWTTIEVEFTNGFKKSYRSFSEIELIVD